MFRIKSKVMKTGTSIVFLFAITFLSCNKDENLEEFTSESKLVGTWNGYQTVDKQENHDDLINNHPPYSIAFAYDNGIEILADGKLYGRLADDTMDPNTTFRRFPDYLESWKLLGDNKVRLADLEYSIISLTDSELVIYRDVNSSSSIIIKLKKE